MCASASASGAPASRWRAPLVRFKSKRKRTNARGVARMRVTVVKARKARATKRIGCTKRRATARVRLR